MAKARGKGRVRYSWYLRCPASSRNGTRLFADAAWAPAAASSADAGADRSPATAATARATQMRRGCVRWSKVSPLRISFPVIQVDVSRHYTQLPASAYRTVAQTSPDGLLSPRQESALTT